jgi:hypothetical protein
MLQEITPMRNSETTDEWLRVHVVKSDQSGDWSAILFLDWLESGDPMGELQTEPVPTLCGAIESMARLVLTFGYRGKLYFEGDWGEDYGTMDYAEDVPKYRKPWQMDPNA